MRRRVNFLAYSAVTGKQITGRRRWTTAQAAAHAQFTAKT
jgi:hypothetical protein